MTKLVTTFWTNILHISQYSYVLEGLHQFNPLPAQIDWPAGAWHTRVLRRQNEARKVTCLYYTLQVYRTNGVSIFIDYCTARKVEGGERDIQLVHVNEANSCLAWGYCVYCKLAQGEQCLSNPLPPPFLSHSPSPSPWLNCVIFSVLG